MKEEISALRMLVLDFKDHVKELLEQSWPVNAIEYVKVPHYDCDIVWMAFRFNTIEERQRFEGDLSIKLKNCLSEEVKEQMIKQGYIV